jgi:Fe-S cluster biogenesis protein NfuA
MKTVEEIQQMLDSSVNELLGQHRGRVEIASIDRQSANHEGGTVHCVAAYVKMVGGCRGCAGAKYTLNMIVSSHIKAFDPTIDHIVDITDHTDKTDAFYKE